MVTERDMEGRQTLVTGAATEIGREIVRAFARRGAMVIAVDASDAVVERAIEAIGLADADAVITRGLCDEELGAWWDLSNLIAAYYHALDVFVHIPRRSASKSLPLAAARLAQAFANADDADPGCVAIFAIARDPEDAERARKLAEHELAAARPGLHVLPLAPAPPQEIARDIVARITANHPPRIERGGTPS